MNSREKFARAMKHAPLVCPPLDMGATSLTSMSDKCQSALRDFLGFTGEPAPAGNGIDQRILEWAGTDFRTVGGMVDLPGRNARRISANSFIDCWGVRRELTGAYWEIVNSPLRGAARADLAAYPWPEARIEEAKLAEWEKDAKTLRTADKHVIIAEHPVFGILELGCWLCGYDEFLMKLACDRGFVLAFFEKVFNIQMAVSEQYYSALGPYIDLTMSGDDFGMQTGPLFSPETFAEMIAPFFRARIKRTRELAGCYYWHHTCGSVFALIDQLISCGVDILNPVQTSAADMEALKLKTRFGDRLVFWGAVDVQGFLPKATPDQVRARVDDLINVLGKNGGYVIAPAHNMQDDIPPENIVALVDAVRKRRCDEENSG